MRYVVALMSIIFVSLIAGCTSIGESGTGTTNLLSLVEHPEDYYNKSVTVIAFPQRDYKTGYDPEYNYDISERNEEGKPVSMIVKYDRFYCIKCEITGIVEKIRVCTCQQRTMDFLGGYTDEWTDMYSYTGAVPVSYCLERENHRCKEGSEIDVYYLDVTKVKALEYNGP
jgi:hypothetical protein